MSCQVQDSTSMVFGEMGKNYIYSLITLKDTLSEISLNMSFFSKKPHITNERRLRLSILLLPTLVFGLAIQIQINNRDSFLTSIISGENLGTTHNLDLFIFFHTGIKMS